MYFDWSKKKVEIIRLLIDAGADVNARGSDKLRPLQRALALDNSKAAQMLREAGAYEEEEEEEEKEKGEGEEEEEAEEDGEREDGERGRQEVL